MKIESKINDYFDLLSEDELFDEILIIPYKEREFKEWLIEHRKISTEYANRYVNYFESAYERLFEIVGLDLYDLLRKFIDEMPKNTGNSLTKGFAVDLTERYVEAIQEELDKDPDSYTKEELRAFLAYRDFIASISGDETENNPKPTGLPFKDEFIDWLCKDLGMDYENAKKEASAAKNSGFVLNKLADTENNLIELASTITNNDHRDEILATLLGKKGLLEENKSMKTIQNGCGALNKYFLFLKDKNK